MNIKLTSIILIMGITLGSCLNKATKKKRMSDEVEDTILVGSLSELAQYASKDHVNVKMKPGEYQLNDTSFSQNIILKKYRDGKPTDDYPITALINFSGNNSRYELDGVLINLDTKLHQAFGRNHIFEIFVSGNNNTIEGLKVRDIGHEVPIRGAIMMHVMGDDNTISNVDLFIQGSYPYGYGHLLGKGAKPLVKPQKHSSLLVSGKNTKLLGCKVVTHAFGHGIVMQGAYNTLIKDCYVEGKIRSTDEMLAETSGPAFCVDFKSDYPPGKILPNEIKALSEDGVRSYPYGYLVGRKTEGITVINTTVKNMRSGFDLGAHQSPTKIIGCTAIGCQEKGFAVIKDAIIKDCKGDAMYGPLLTFQGNKAENCDIELELINTESDYPFTRIAEINGTGHKITLKNFQGIKRTNEVPIVFGESFWSDVHKFRKPDADPSMFSGAYDITLINETGMPIVFEKLSANCKVESNGRMIKDDGEDNQVVYSRKSATQDVNKNEVVVINKGIGGNSTKDLQKRIDGDVLEQNPDLVILMVGTNDMLNSRKMLSYEEYAGNLIQIVKTIKANDSQVLMMSSPPADSAYLFQRHDRTLYKQAPNAIMDSVSHIVEQIALDNDALYINLFGEFSAMNIPSHNEDLFIRNEKNSNKKDGVHPTPLGYYFIAQNLYQYLKENDLLKAYKKIICFGDSITNGAGAKGGGSVTGENYPSFLYRMLNKNINN